MPLYEYECSVCKHRFELIRKFSDKPVTVCPDCGSPVIRLLSSPAIQFKGTGWYVTDYAGKNASGGETKKEDKENGAGEKGTAEKASPSTATGSDKGSQQSSGTSPDKPAKS